MVKETLRRHQIDLPGLRRFSWAWILIFALAVMVTTGIDKARYVATDIDTALRPAGEVYHDKTRVISRTRGIGGYRPGDSVVIFGSGKRYRDDCETTFKRTLIWPDGTQSNLPDGLPTQQAEGGVYITIPTESWWPAGDYQYKSQWLAKCHIILPPQKIEGVTARFTLR